jgi:hypothetical protein
LAQVHVQKGVGERRLVESRRVTELEGEIKRLKSISTTQQIDHKIDQSVIERAAKSAVERERLAEAELEQGRADFRKMIGAAASAAQAVDKLKVLLEKTESEWVSPAAAFETPGASAHRRPNLVSKPANHRTASAESLDGPLRLR